ncbi:hypothetical protein QBC35DRAFT_452754 [Podospora australis]|uniref:Uncharacterized protein n=1 Tax=Podospora australis TaxID=1536484 RepID=A0AAN7AH07_9PEZI|nr:hypothetical protein QBC35DRAFT_452754 [Podospora australis]
MANPEELSPDIWHKLPQDLLPALFDELIASYLFTDPPYTWTTLRHISSYTLRAVEREFARFWLPKLSLTLYNAAWDPTFDFELAGGHFLSSQVQPPNSKRKSCHHWRNNSVAARVAEYLQTLRDAWTNNLEKSKPGRKVLTARLGEGFLSSGMQGGYIVGEVNFEDPAVEMRLDGVNPENGGNDTSPHVNDSSRELIRFKWKQMMGRLLREEMLLRQEGQRLFRDACAEWRTSEGLAADEDVPPEVQLKLWILKVQHQRRVALARKNEKCLGEKPYFSTWSKGLHRQEPSDPEEVAALRNSGCCTICMRTQGPHLYEVVATEESCVPNLDLFKR